MGKNCTEKRKLIHLSVLIHLSGVCKVCSYQRKENTEWYYIQYDPKNSVVFYTMPNDIFVLTQTQIYGYHSDEINNEDKQWKNKGSSNVQAAECRRVNIIWLYGKLRQYFIFK